MARLDRPLDGDSLLLSSLCDVQGHDLAVIKSLSRGDQAARAVRRFASFDHAEVDATSGEEAAPPYLQFHLLARTTTEMTPERIDELVRFFLEARRQLRPKCLPRPAAAPATDAAL
jgi:hypothetical protein